MKENRRVIESLCNNKEMGSHAKERKNRRAYFESSATSKR
jgi:hypothetical protein